MVYKMSSGLFDEETIQALKQLFGSFKKELNDYLVVDDLEKLSKQETSTHHHHIHPHHEGCPTCGEAKLLAEELSKISEGKLRFKIIDLKNAETATLKPRYTPAFIYDTPKKNIRYYGLPSGQEFAPFIYIHQYIANNIVKLPGEVIDLVKSIETPLHIKIFVTPECPYCPIVVDAINQMGLVNDLLLVETIEAIELPLEADMYGVSYVPDIIITDPEKQTEYGVEPIERINGYMPPEELAKIIKNASEKLSKK